MSFTASTEHKAGVSRVRATEWTRLSANARSTASIVHSFEWNCVCVCVRVCCIFYWSWHRNCFLHLLHSNDGSERVRSFTLALLTFLSFFIHIKLNVVCTLTMFALIDVWEIVGGLQFMFFFFLQRILWLARMSGARLARSLWRRTFAQCFVLSVSCLCQFYFELQKPFAWNAKW